MTYTYTLPDGSRLECVDLGLRRASCPDVGLGPMPAVDLHEMLDARAMLLGVGPWTFTYKHEFRATCTRMADALCAQQNVARRAKRARWDAGYPIVQDLAAMLVLAPVAVGVLLVFVGCAPVPCLESATLPESGVPVTCPDGAQVAVDRAEEGPVVMCLCSANVEVTP